MECEHCHVILRSKYILKSHLLNSKTCLKIRGLTIQTKFICPGCDIMFMNNANLNIHTEACKKYILLKVNNEHNEEIEKIQKEREKERENYEKDLLVIIENNKKEREKETKKQRNNYEKEYETRHYKLRQEVNKLEQEVKDKDKALADAHLQIDKLQKMLGDIASKAVDKPTTTVNNQIRNCFSTTQFLEDIKPADVKRKCQTNLTEQILMEGQRGICTEQFINTTDKKKLLISTDHSCAKFRYMDKNGNMKDDIEARTFIEKVSKPIKEVADIVFDNVLSCIKDEKEMLEEDDYGRKAELNNKELQANTSMMYIKCFDDPNNNSDFTNELSILNQSK